LRTQSFFRMVDTKLHHRRMLYRHVCALLDHLSLSDQRIMNHGRQPLLRRHRLRATQEPPRD
jgi:hypothetical protein